jgi:dipeptidyl aminopeptidase/acylaminoacyl peptidase
MAEFLRSISPLTHVKRIADPLLVIHGANDPRVPASEAQQLVSAVREGGQRVWYLLAHDEGHGFRKQANRETAQMLAIYFAERMLEKKD